MPNEPSLPSPAPEILDYLARHPDAEDTIEGMLQWWVLDSCIRNWAPKIEQTVTELTSRGLLEARTSREGRVLYRLARDHRTSFLRP